MNSMQVRHKKENRLNNCIQKMIVHMVNMQYNVYSDKRTNELADLYTKLVEILKAENPNYNYESIIYYEIANLVHNMHA